jgi:hypothetical protein
VARSLDELAARCFIARGFDRIRPRRPGPEPGDGASPGRTGGAGRP